VNQVVLYALFIVMVSVFALVARTLVTLAGNPPGTKLPQSVEPTACIMWIQKSTSCAFTGSPLDHFQPFMLMVTFLPL
jgi:hypothetical protein